jgi:superfamily II DNA or RNA helicase
MLEVLDRRHLCVDSSGTGTGKTYTAAWAAGQIGHPVLVVCPKSVITTWERILGEFGVREAIVHNVEQYKTKKRGFWDGSSWKFDKYWTIIWDEVHRGTAGPYSDTTEMLAKLKAWPTLPKIPLSATVADSPIQMRAIGWLLGMHGYLDPLFWKWCEDMGCEWTKRPNGRGGFENVLGMPIVRERAIATMQRLRDAMAPYMVRLDQQDVPGFPENQITAKLFDFDKALTAHAREMYEPLARAHYTSSDNQKAQITMARYQTEIMKVPIIADLAKDILAEGRSVVIFCNFHEPMDLLAAALGPDKVVQFRGDRRTTPQERAEDQERFQRNEIHIALCQSQCGGESIGLHDVRQERPRMSLISPNWDAKLTKQCLGRVHRDGGTRTTQMFVLAANTIEEQVYRAIIRKAANIDTLNDADMMGVEMLTTT